MEDGRRVLAERCLRRLVAEQLGVGPDELTPDASLADDLAVDSLDRDREESGASLWCLPVRARVDCARARGEGVERAELLTPYAIQLVGEDAARAGRGARLEVTVPARTSAGRREAVRRALAWLGRYGVEVSVRRTQVASATR